MTTASDTSAPVITAALANDTGVSASDGITYDPTISGVVDDPSGVASFQAGLDGGKLVDVTALLSGLGFTFTAANLATINGGTPLPDGKHTLSLQATDSLGYTSTPVSLSFDLETTRPLPPANVHLIASDLTGTSNTITKDRTLTVELSAPAGTIVTVYMSGTPIGQQTATSAPLDFAVPGSLADGQYIFTATAATVSGLVSPVLDTLHRDRGQHHSGDRVVRAGCPVGRPAFRPQPDADGDRGLHRPDRAGSDSGTGRDRRQDHVRRVGQFLVLPREPAEPGRFPVHGPGDRRRGQYQ